MAWHGRVGLVPAKNGWGHHCGSQLQENRYDKPVETERRVGFCSSNSSSSRGMMFIPDVDLAAPAAAAASPSSALHSPLPGCLPTFFGARLLQPRWIFVDAAARELQRWRRGRRRRIKTGCWEWITRCGSRRKRRSSPKAISRGFMCVMLLQANRWPCCLSSWFQVFSKRRGFQSKFVQRFVLKRKDRYQSLDAEKISDSVIF